MNESFKYQLVALLNDMDALCAGGRCIEGRCSNARCPLSFDGWCQNNVSSLRYNFEGVSAAVENYRARKKQRAEGIDEALDTYVLEVDVKRNTSTAKAWTPEQGAQFVASYIKGAYQGDCVNTRVLSAKRYVLESSKEETK